MHKRPRNEWCYKPNHRRYGRDRTGSRFSPEGSPRGHRMHNSEYRNYNHGGSHLRNRHADEFQPPMPVRSKNDILMEAGRLAAEYLVSVGKLPPDALSKCQNDDLKIRMGKTEGFERPKVENERSRKDGRVSSRSHSLDVEPDRRRYSDEHRSTRSRKSEKWRRSESFRERRPEREREFSRSRSWATWRRSSPNRDSDNNRPTVGKDGNGGVQNSFPSEITEGSRSAHLEPGWGSWSSMEKESAHEEYVPVKQGRNDCDFNQIDEKKDEISAYERGDNVDLLDYSKDGNTHNKLMTMDPNTDQHTLSSPGEITEGGRSAYLEPGWESWGTIEKESTHEEYVPVKQGQNDGDFNQIDDKNEISAFGREDDADLLNYSKYGNGHNKLMTMNAGDTISEREFQEPYVPEFVVHNFMSTVPSNQDHELRNANSNRGVKQEMHDDTDGWESYKRIREGVHAIDDRCQLTLGGIFDHSIANLPPTAVTGKEASSVDVGLSMQRNSNQLNIKREVNNDDIVYIYSEDEDDKSFSNRGRSANEIPGLQEGYGRKISKLLGNDSPTSSSVTRDLIS